jgi:hypothetical protein
MTPFLISWEIQLGELGQYSDGCRLVKLDLIALGQELFSSLLHQAWLCGPPRLVKLEITLFPQHKQLQHEVDHSFTYSKVWNTWSYTTPSPHALMRWCLIMERTNFHYKCLVIKSYCMPNIHILQLRKIINKYINTVLLKWRNVSKDVSKRCVKRDVPQIVINGLYKYEWMNEKSIW